MSSDLYPMSLSPTRQYEIFALAAFAGLVLGAVYCLLPALRRGLHTCRLADEAADFLFAIFGGGVFFVLSVAQAGGARLFVLLGMLVGLAAWRFTLGRLEILLLSPVFAGLGRLLHLTLGRPYDKIKQKLKIVFVKNKSKSKKLQKKPEKDLKL